MAELRYTDGIRILNVYQRQHRGDEPGRRRGHSLRERLFGEKHGGGRGRGRGRGGGHGFGPPGREHMTVVDHGTEKAVRYHGESRVVVVVGDLRADELVRIAESVGNAAGNDR
jgi:hypothetical protein